MVFHYLIFSITLRKISQGNTENFSYLLDIPQENMRISSKNFGNFWRRLETKPNRAKYCSMSGAD